VSGPAPQGELAELLRKVRELELVARRNAAGLLAGNYVTAVRGRGMMFHEARRYVPGDDTRLIDWKMTARLREPYVRVHLDEREREIFIALDVSPSMKTGWQEKTKMEYAVELAATLAVSAVASRDRVGWVLFSNRALDSAPPAGGSCQLFRCLKAFLLGARPSADPCPESDPRAAIHAVQAIRGRRFVVFIISDFIDHDVPDDLRYVQARHDVSLLHVYDPLEFADTSRIRVPAFSPEGKPSYGLVSPGFGENLMAFRSFLGAEASKYRMAVHSFSTRTAVAPSLREFFDHRRRLLLG
jgi:uncharacterized protein (DUF58 family)